MLHINVIWKPIVVHLCSNWCSCFFVFVYYWKMHDMYNSDVLSCVMWESVWHDTETKTKWMPQIQTHIYTDFCPTEVERAVLYLSDIEQLAKLLAVSWVNRPQCSVLTLKTLTVPDRHLLYANLYNAGTGFAKGESSEKKISICLQICLCRWPHTPTLSLRGSSLGGMCLR